MVTAYRWDHTHGCIITVQLRCHARADRLCSNPHFMNSFPNHRSGGAPNVLFLEYRSKIQNDWKLLKCMYLSTVTLLNGVTDMDYRRWHPTGWVRSGFRVGRALGFNCAGVHGSSASRPLASGMCFPHFLSGPGTPGGNLSSGRASAAILPQ